MNRVMGFGGVERKIEAKVEAITVLDCVELKAFQSFYSI